MTVRLASNNNTTNLSAPLSLPLDHLLFTSVCLPHLLIHLVSVHPIHDWLGATREPTLPTNSVHLLRARPAVSECYKWQYISVRGSLAMDVLHQTPDHRFDLCTTTMPPADPTIRHPVPYPLPHAAPQNTQYSLTTSSSMDGKMAEPSSPFVEQSVMGRGSTTMTALGSGSVAAPIVAPVAAPAATGVVAPTIDIDTAPAFAHNTQLLRQQWSDRWGESEQLLASLMQSTIGSGPPIASWRDDWHGVSHPPIGYRTHSVLEATPSSTKLSSGSSHGSENNLSLFGPPVKPFIARLHNMLSHPDRFGDCLVWDADGLCFIVAHTVPRLFEEVLPEAFGHSNLHSFTRQLNIYGFRRCTSAELVDKLDVV